MSKPESRTEVYFPTGSKWISRWLSPQLPLSIYTHDLGTSSCWLPLFHEFILACYTSYWCFSNAPDVSAWDAYCKPAGMNICLLAISVFWSLLTSSPPLEHRLDLLSHSKGVGICFWDLMTKETKSSTTPVVFFGSLLCLRETNYQYDLLCGKIPEVRK